MQTYLNGTYLNSLSNNIQSKIAKVKWNIGGFDSYSITPSQAYTAERGNVGADNSTTLLTWPGKIALAYPSDYGYAATCDKTLIAYDDSACTSTNWMYPVMTRNGQNYCWLLTPGSSNFDDALDVASDGNLSNGIVDVFEYGAFPVLYLSSDAVIESGTVSGVNAYILS